MVLGFCLGVVCEVVTGYEVSQTPWQIPPDTLYYKYEHKGEPRNDHIITRAFHLFDVSRAIKDQ